MARASALDGLTEMNSFDRGLRAILWLNLLDAVGTITWLHMGLATEANALWLETRSLYAQVGIDVGVEECDAHLAALAAQPDDA